MGSNTRDRPHIFLTFKAKKKTRSVTRLTSSILYVLRYSRDTWLVLWERISPLASGREDSISQWPKAGATSLQNSFCPNKASNFNAQGGPGIPFWKPRELTNPEANTPLPNWKESWESPGQEQNSVWGDSRVSSTISKNNCNNTQGSQ